MKIIKNVVFSCFFGLFPLVSQALSVDKFYLKGLVSKIDTESDNDFRDAFNAESFDTKDHVSYGASIGYQFSDNLSAQLDYLHFGKTTGQNNLGMPLEGDPINQGTTSVEVGKKTLGLSMVASTDISRPYYVGVQLGWGVTEETTDFMVRQNDGRVWEWSGNTEESSKPYYGLLAGYKWSRFIASLEYTFLEFEDQRSNDDVMRAASIALRYNF